MKFTRRSFLGSSLTMAAFTPAACGSLGTIRQTPPTDHFDPWVEVEAANLHFNLGQLRRLSNNRPVLAVVKNNAYGLGLTRTALLLEPNDGVAGFGVVKVDAAIALRDAGIKKPILHMGTCSLEDAHTLVAREIQISLYTEDAAKRIDQLARIAGHPIDAHLYFDTGLGRLGMPYHRALPWLVDLTARQDLKIRGSFMGFTEEPDFDREQLRRFITLASEAKIRGVHLGSLHAASSNAVYHLPESHLDMVRPGISLYGAYPTRPKDEMAKAELHPALRLRCRVVRVTVLRKGDSVGYGRNYIASKPTWIATLPAGHVDGVPRDFVKGARVQIGSTTYPIIGAVSASHCMVEIGPERSVDVGQIATIIGPDDPTTHPSQQSIATGVSVYDVLMHINPVLPRYYM